MALLMATSIQAAACSNDNNAEAPAPASNTYVMVHGAGQAAYEWEILTLFSWKYCTSSIPMFCRCRWRKPDSIRALRDWFYPI